MTAERPLLSVARKTLEEGPRAIRAALPVWWLDRVLAWEPDVPTASHAPLPPSPAPAAPAPSPASPAPASSASPAPESAEVDPDAVKATAEGSVDLHLSPAGADQFYLTGVVRAPVTMPCARCLGPAPLALEGEISLLLVPAEHDRKRSPKGKHSKDSEGEFEFDPQEADVATYDGETIVLDELVREALVLELPISPLCSEACAGMAAGPAKALEAPQERPVDPRLAPLAALRDKLPDAGDAAKKGKS